MDRLLTKTLAEIYLQQGHLEEAYAIFKALSEKKPGDPELESRLKELEEKLALSAPQPESMDSATEKKVRTLEKWLSNIRGRRPG